MTVTLLMMRLVAIIVVEVDASDQGGVILPILVFTCLWAMMLENNN